MGFILSCLSSYFIESTISKLFDDLSSGNMELRNASDPSEIELRNAFKQYKNGEINVVDLSTVTTFSWDRIYMLGAYSQPSEIAKVVGRSWRENCFTNISLSEGTLLVFTANKIVIHCIDFADSDGIFLIPEEGYREGISHKEALFVVNENNLVNWVGNKDQ